MSLSCLSQASEYLSCTCIYSLYVYLNQVPTKHVNALKSHSENASLGTPVCIRGYDVALSIVVDKILLLGVRGLHILSMQNQGRAG